MFPQYLQGIGISLFSGLDHPLESQLHVFVVRGRNAGFDAARFLSGTTSFLTSSDKNFMNLYLFVFRGSRSIIPMRLNFLPLGSIQEELAIGGQLMETAIFPLRQSRFALIGRTNDGNMLLLHLIAKPAAG